ncbi:MAG: sodium:proton antiporter [Pseudomonadota bacterium]|nr:sodium:proton antiporter [Pseudomonadota bacterium]
MVTSTLSQLGILLLIASLVAIISRRLRMPYTVGLVLAGMGLYFSRLHFTVHLSKDLIFSVFLPPLVFEAALCIRWTDFKKDLPIISVLATVGVALAALVTASGMHYLLQWQWLESVLFGVLIAATDPVSVIATFKESGLQGRLRLLVESESLLNDGTAAVAFVAVLGVMSGQQQSVVAVSASLILTIGAGSLIGALIGYGCMILAGRTRDPLVEFTLTTLAAYGSFFIAEHFHFSGVLAALSAGLVVGNYRVFGAAGDGARHGLLTFWEYAAFIANSLIFILIGLQEAQQRFDGLWLPALAAIALVTFGRAVSIYPLCALFSRTHWRVDKRHQHLLFWGGLRGALALALALALPEELPRRGTIVALTFAVVAFSVFVQGLTITPLLRRLGQLPPSSATDAP